MAQKSFLPSLLLFLCLILCLTLTVGGINAQDTLVIYADALASGWQNWSWDTTISFSAGSPAHGGTNALAATYNAGWAGVYLRSGAALPAGYDTLRFWINGGATGGQQIQIAFYNQAGTSTNATTVTAPVNSWLQVDVPLSSFGASNLLWGVVWQENTGSAKPTFRLDDIQLLGSGGGSTPIPPGVGPALTIDAAANQVAISPYIYGMNFSSTELAEDIDLPVHRWGGNATTRYNWLLDTSNRGADWFFQNIPNNPANVALLPDGSAADLFIADNEAHGTETLITLPMIGWTPRSRVYAECGFRVSVYGAQQTTDVWYPDCGNGVRTNGTFVTGNNPLDTSIVINETFVEDWIAHLQDEFGIAAQGGVRFYALDNEVSLWNSTHRDVRPLPLGSIELRDRTIQYASAIKGADPGALTLGPVEFGWTGYFFSGVDQASQQWGNPPELALRGGLPLVPWYLDQLRQYEQNNGTRLLDYLTLHYYPQATGVTLSPVGNAATQALRLRSTRALWDPSYVDESWIGESVYLIPRMRDWVDTYYPGTKLAITEYNWGGYEHINGALAQADVLGIFGREGLDLATLWTAPEPTQPVAYAFRMYRNYDGAGGKFGETSVSAQSADQSRLSTYAARRADGALTIMVINKTSESLTTPVQIANFAATSAQVYRYSAANLSQIVHESNLAVVGGSVSTAFPPNSITLLVFMPTANAALPGHLTLSSRPPAGQPIFVQFSVSGVSAGSHNANLDTSGGFQINSLIPAVYQVRVKHVQHLANAVNVTLPAAITPVEFGLLRSGDVNDDNTVTISDFSILASAFGKTNGQVGYDARADLNGDNGVTISDFSLLASNFGESGAS